MKIVFMGSPDFAVPSLLALKEKGFEIPLVITQPDRPAGRAKKLMPTAVKLAAQSLGIPVWQRENINQPESLEKIKELRPDFLVVVAFGQILKRELLELPVLGSINLHASLLPKYRGAAPIHWALLKGEELTGVTTMFMNEGMDTGDIIYKSSLPILEEDNLGSLFEKLADIGSALLVKTLEDLAAHKIRPVPQDHREATYAPMIKKETEKIPWERDAKEIFNLIRGLYPWPIAYTLWQGKRLKLGAAAVCAAKGSLGRAGEILEITPQGPVVACGQGSLLLKMLQPEGKNMMEAKAFLSGHKLEKGMLLG